MLLRGLCQRHFAIPLLQIYHHEQRCSRKCRRVFLKKHRWGGHRLTLLVNLEFADQMVVFVFRGHSRRIRAYCLKFSYTIPAVASCASCSSNYAIFSANMPSAAPPPWTNHNSASALLGRVRLLPVDRLTSNSENPSNSGASKDRVIISRRLYAAVVTAGAAVTPGLSTPVDPLHGLPFHDLPSPYE